VAFAAGAAAGRSIAWLGDENWGRAVAGDPPPDRAVAPGIMLHGGEIELADGADPVADPTLALQAAVAAARHDQQGDPEHRECAGELADHGGPPAGADHPTVTGVENSTGSTSVTKTVTASCHSPGNGTVTPSPM